MREPDRGRAGKGVGVRSGEVCGPCARILADGQWSAFGVYQATSTCVCALESYLAVMWKWSRKRLLAAGQCTKWHAKLVGAMRENPTSNFGFFRKQNWISSDCSFFCRSEELPSPYVTHGFALPGYTQMSNGENGQQLVWPFHFKKWESCGPLSERICHDPKAGSRTLFQGWIYCLLCPLHSYH